MILTLNNTLKGNSFKILVDYWLVHAESSKEIISVFGSQCGRMLFMSLTMHTNDLP